MKHTPGPWTLDEDTYTVLGDGRNVTRVHTVDDFICDGDDAEVAEECAANAALIAAAPELFEAAVGALLWLDNLERVVGKDTLLDCLPNDFNGRIGLREAIRKATYPREE